MKRAILPLMIILMCMPAMAAGEACITYFTSLNCPNCAITDPTVLGQWPQGNVVVVEYVFSSWADEHAALLGQYANKYGIIAAVPTAYLSEYNGVGRVEVVALEDNLKDEHPCRLLERDVHFSDLKLEDLPMRPKIWANSRVLERIGGDPADVKHLLFSEELQSALEELDAVKIDAEPVPIARGSIEFANAARIGDSWILYFNEAVNLSAPVVETSEPDDEPGAEQLVLPLFGRIDTDGSLALLTVLIAAADGFNPCAFFILTFLLASLLYASGHKEDPAEKRLHIALVGFIFVFFSAMVYFVFMALWFNAFMWVREIMILTVIAGVIAVFAGAVNIKDYFAFQKGISLTLPKSEKLKFMEKVKKLQKATSLHALLLGTVVIAATVNLYELICTVGFPMIYLRILTTRELSGLAHYGYLALYNIIYVIPITIIVVISVVSLGTKKFQKDNVQRLKLISGFMVLFLGLVLIFAPELLENIAMSFGLIIAAVVCGLAVMLLSEKVFHAGPEP